MAQQKTEYYKQILCLAYERPKSRKKARSNPSRKTLESSLYEMSPPRRGFYNPPRVEQETFQKGFLETILQPSNLKKSRISISVLVIGTLERKLFKTECIIPATNKADKSPIRKGNMRNSSKNLSDSKADPCRGGGKKNTK